MLGKAISSLDMPYNKLTFPLANSRSVRIQWGVYWGYALHGLPLGHTLSFLLISGNDMVSMSMLAFTNRSELVDWRFPRSFYIQHFTLHVSLNLWESQMTGAIVGEPYNNNEMQQHSAYMWKYFLSLNMPERKTKEKKKLLVCLNSGSPNFH